MHREEMEQLLVGYIYGELGAEERAEVERELVRDPEWAKTLEELRVTSGILRRWEDEDPGVRHLVAGPAAGARARVRSPLRRVSWRRLVPAAVGVAALLLVALNTQVALDNGRVRVSLGRGTSPLVSSVGGSGGIPLDITETAEPYITEEDFLRSQAELVRFVAALLEESERQSDRFLTALAEYENASEARREGDLVFMDRRLGVVERGARDLVDRVARTSP